ncbi:MAG: hypothetical protein P4M08_14940 [Oligoflexia bacterium]|nr:hypothetical protein [Oligoflexia bacterium]
MKRGYIVTLLCVLAARPLLAEDSTPNFIPTHTRLDQVACVPPAENTLSTKDIAMLTHIANGLNEGLAPICDNANCDEFLAWAKDKSEHYPYCAPFFVDKNGKVGPLAIAMAKRVAQDIKENGTHSVFMQKYPQFQAACPGFSKMNGSEMVGFYTYFFEILAYSETTCNPSEKSYAANVPNGPAVGLYQLEYDPRLRSWRGPACGVSRQEIMTAEGNTACAFDIFKAQLQAHHDPFGSINSKGLRTQTNYWQSLNPLPPSQAKYRDLPYNRMLHYLHFYPFCSLPTEK